ncbi:MAG: N-acetyltransferase [Gammaproteobacteria bacterium]|nr:N-acetyltransferase [Gammaproteobacteria bacterium]MCP4091584.1 N-acetyltransferase [Gammaproteobacteria bacterium]MCP4276080.1 N-acetyltransferase [Gammaproteobacteria bacterium]MCP4832572.1 N-acetyltransferase [Gammaproteobacteria bacterium]MCP4929650.1 N-acetyltransferase [Gammaproteobacteria bacterium]
MSDTRVSIRTQNHTTDLKVISAINKAAFTDHGNTRSFDRLRAQHKDIISLVADVNGEAVGHILFSPAIMATPAGPINGMGLGQLAVMPNWQKKGIGTHLAETGITQLRTQSCPFIIVIGHASYYPRFGFEQGQLHGVKCQWDSVPDESFMVLYPGQNQLEQGKLNGVASFDGL